MGGFEVQDFRGHEEGKYIQYLQGCQSLQLFVWSPWKTLGLLQPLHKQKSPCLFTSKKKSSIFGIGDCFDTIRTLNSVSTAQAGKVLHSFIVCFTQSTTTRGAAVDIWGIKAPPCPPQTCPCREFKLIQGFCRPWASAQGLLMSTITIQVQCLVTTLYGMEWVKKNPNKIRIQGVDF